MFDSPALSEASPTPSVARRWHEEAVEWIQWKRTTKGQYQGRNGQEAVRFLSRFGERLEIASRPRSPRTFDEVDLRELAPGLGTAPKTRRFYLGILGSFLQYRGNDVVRASGILSTIPQKATHRRWLTIDQLDQLTDRAIGIERLVVALEGFQGLRRVEVLRCRVGDLDTSGSPWWLWIRGKAHQGEPSRRVPVSDRVRKELGWYLPLRAQWAIRSEDRPELLVWEDRGRLRTYSAGSVDRFVRTAGQRIGITVSNHDLRRTFGRVLKNRGADWREIAGLYGHASIAQSEYYVGQEQDRLAAAIALLEGKP